MKNSTNSLQFKDIVLFMDPENRSSKDNFLKTITRYIKSQTHLPNRFSYSGSDNDLSRVLTLKENLSFEGLLSNGESIEDFNLAKHISDIHNPYLLKLFKCLPDKDTHIDKLDKSQLKLASLIKALLKESPVYILEKPDENLDKKTVAMVQQAIDHLTRLKNKIFIIKANSQSLWHNMANKILYKHNKGNFQLAVLPAQQLLDNFDSFIKQEDLSSDATEETVLNFKNIPEHLIAK